MELGREAAERLDISATPAATPSSQTVEVETFALRNVITGWSVDLEGALPAGAGTIFEINAVTIGSAASIDTVLHKNLAAPTGGTMEVAVLSGADPQDAILETVTAPVVQKTLFLNGTMFETRMIDGTWNTIVTATSPSQPWQVGDVLVGDLSTGTMFNQRTSLPVFLENAQIADRARLTVAVRRDGGVIPVDFSNPQ